VDNSFGEDGFQIEDHEVHQSEYILVDTVPGNTTSAMIDHLNPGTMYSFRVRAHSSGNNSDYSNTMTVTTFPNPGTLCQAPAVCFNQSRFSVTAQWKTPDGRSGAGNVVRLTDDSGYFWFFDPTNVEAVFKVINGCAAVSASISCRRPRARAFQAWAGRCFQQGSGERWRVSQVA
jgi:hypothetical protein